MQEREERSLEIKIEIEQVTNHLVQGWTESEEEESWWCVDI